MPVDLGSSTSKPSVTTTSSSITTPKTRTFQTTTWRVLGLFVPILFVVAGYATISGVNASKSGPLGLIEVLPVSYFVIVAFLVMSFAWHVRRATLDAAMLTMHVLALIVLLHGAVSWIEQNPRFPVVYTHIGLTEYIQRTGETLPTLDARMNWPGFFSVTALLDKVAGTDSIFPFLLWAPLVFNLLYAPLLFSLSRTASTDPRVPWIALWLYYTLSWVGQDYFSPQALNFLFFLSFMVIVLRCFRTDRAALPRPIRRIGNGVGLVVGKVLRVKNFQPGGAPILATTTLQRSLLVGTLVALYAASVMSHQLTPVFLLLYVTALVILRKTVLRGFPLLMAVLFLSFISYGAIGFWSGHINDMFGGFGKVGGTVKDNVGSKVQVSTSHVWVIYSRLALAATVWGVTILGLLRRLRAGRVDLAPLVGFIVPFFVLGGQSYGGEVILRVFLFSLPFATIFITFSLLPTEKVRLNAVRTGIFLIAGILLAPAFMLTRYGNEQFEYISKDDYKGVLQLAKIAPKDSSIITLDGNVGNQVGRMEQFAYITVPPEAAPDYKVEKIYEVAINAPGSQTFFFLNRSQVANIQLTYGKPASFFDDMTKQLVATGKFRVIYENPDARIFTVDTSTPDTTSLASSSLDTQAKS